MILWIQGPLSAEISTRQLSQVSWLVLWIQGPLSAEISTRQLSQVSRLVLWIQGSQCKDINEVSRLAQRGDLYRVEPRSAHPKIRFR